METQKARPWHSTVIIDERLLERRAAVRDEHAGAPEILEPGTRLGRYLIVGRLGGGGMGIVYKAQDLELERTVALKILPPHLCKHPDYVNRFRAEAQAQARLSNPHVVTLYSFLELPIGEVLVLEYVEGETLESRLRSQGPLAPEAAVAVFEQALRGLEHIHARRVVHRDLKPANIFITRDNVVKILDFGVSRIMDGRDVSQRGAMVGTLLYISPEQINGRETDFRSDIYTLGIGLFEAVTGRLPFERRTDYALMHAHVQERPPRPKQLSRRIPPGLEWVILKAIEKEPQRRFQSASEFRQALLTLGVMERRRVTEVSDAPAGLPGAAFPGQGWMSHRRQAHSRLLGSLWLDIGLVAAVLGLVFALGLYPVKPRPAEEAQPPAAVAKPPVAAKTTRDSARERRVTTPPARTPAAPEPTEPARDERYDVLREAWGG